MTCPAPRKSGVYGQPAGPHYADDHPEHTIALTDEQWIEYESIMAAHEALAGHHREAVGDQFLVYAALERPVDDTWHRVGEAMRWRGERQPQD